MQRLSNKSKKVQISFYWSHGKTGTVPDGKHIKAVYEVGLSTNTIGSTDDKYAS
eukprot:m.316747 g.316747  ORF g.316747 m.316747 type:complete len:54 (+) comp1350294_c0_seq1:22-183(+)